MIGKILGNYKIQRVVGIFFFLSVLAYANAITHPFVHDDVVFIENNPSIQNWNNLHEVFVHPLLKKGSTTIVNAYYRPFLEVVYKIEYVFFQGNPHGYHIINILLHILNGILVYMFLSALLGDKLLSFWAGLLFLIHPIQTEAVACISGISNLLFSLFCLLSLILYRRGVAEKRGNKAYGFSLLFFLLALLTKEQAIILPFLILLCEYCFFSSYGQKNIVRFWRFSGFFGTIFLYFLWRKLILGVSLPAIKGNHELWLRVLSIPGTLLSYFRIIIFPVDLRYYRCTDILTPTFFPIIFLVILAGFLAIVIQSLSLQHRKIAIFGVGWFFITLLPMLNIAPLIVEYSFIMTAEHFLYLPLVGFLLAFLAVGKNYPGKEIQKTNEPKKFALVFFILFILITLTVKQNSYWRGEIPLFERSLKFEKKLGRLHILLARSFYFNHQNKEAIVQYAKALEIIKGYAQKARQTTAESFYLNFIKEIHFDLAHCYEAMNDFENAIAEYQEALKVCPKDTTVLNNLGAAYLYLSHLDKAMEYFRQAVSFNSQDTMALNNLALCYVQEKNFEEAKTLFKKVLTIDSHFVSARFNLEKLEREQFHPQ